jgi:hypothetical protein
MWGALSDERTGLSFIYAAGPRQRSLSRVRVPWDSWPYFTVSDLRLPISSPPTTRRVTMDVFDPASTWVRMSLSLIILPMASRPVYLGIKHPSGLTTRWLLLSDNCVFVDMWCSFLREDGSVVYNAAGPRQRSPSRVRVPLDSWPNFTVSCLILLF